MEWDARSLQNLAPFSSQHRRETNVSGKTPRLTDPGDQLTVTRRLASMGPRPDARAEDVRVSLFSTGSIRLPKNVATGSLLSKASQGQERTQLRTSHFPSLASNKYPGRRSHVPLEICFHSLQRRATPADQAVIGEWGGQFLTTGAGKLTRKCTIDPGDKQG